MVSFVVSAFSVCCFFDTVLLISFLAATCKFPAILSANTVYYIACQSLSSLSVSVVYCSDLWPSKRFGAYFQRFDTSLQALLQQAPVYTRGVVRSDEAKTTKIVSIGCGAENKAY